MQLLKTIIRVDYPKQVDILRGNIPDKIQDNFFIYLDEHKKALSIFDNEVFDLDKNKVFRFESLERKEIIEINASYFSYINTNSNRNIFESYWLKFYTQYKTLNTQRISLRKIYQIDNSINIPNKIKESNLLKDFCCQYKFLINEGYLLIKERPNLIEVNSYKDEILPVSDVVKYLEEIDITQSFFLADFSKC